MANTQAYGFVGLESLFSETLENANIAVIDDAIRQTVEEHNRQIQAATGDLFAFTTEHKVRFRQPGSGTLQPMDQWGNPLPTKPSGYYDIAFPIQGGGDAFGNNRITRPMMTVSDINDHILDIQRKDADWMKRHMLAALFTNTTWSYTDERYGALTVQPLANGDASLYPRSNGTVSADTHHLAQAATVSDANNPFPTIYTELMEHPVNAGGQVVAYIPTNLVTAVTGLANFVEVSDPFVNQPDSVATLNSVPGRAWGDEVLGRVDKVWIAEASILPDNYIVANVRGAVSPALWARQYPVASLQGLFRENHSPDGNLQEYRFLRFCGFGSYNRVGAVVYFVNAGDTTYDIPSGYEAPLAV